MSALDDGEVLRTPLDSRRAGSGLPGEGMRRRDQNGRRTATPGRAMLWCVNETVTFEPAPVWGAYPLRFVKWAVQQVDCRPDEVLHVCSGALGREVGGVRVDLRAAAAPTIRADGAALPFRDESFAAVLLDPPYSVEYARELYGTDYPRPSHLLAEAGRVVRRGGLVGMLHFLVPSPGPRLEFVCTRGISQGCGYRMRAFTLFRRPNATLFDDEQPSPFDPTGALDGLEPVLDQALEDERRRAST